MRKVIGESGEVDKARVDLDRIEEPKQVTKKESQRAFEQLLNRFQNSLKFEDKHIVLLNQIKEALDLINSDEKIQKKGGGLKIQIKNIFCKIKMK